jgi:hypothetical protein
MTCLHPKTVVGSIPISVILEAFEKKEGCPDPALPIPSIAI